MKNDHELTPEQMTAFDEAMKANDDKFGLTDFDLEMPELYDKNAKTNFTDEEVKALTATDNDETVKLAFGATKESPKEVPLLDAPKAKKTEGK